jgi:Zn-dependent protease/CBS domain-containing protein
MFRGGWRIARIGGVDIRVDTSWIVLVVLATVNMWLLYSDQSRFPDVTSGLAVALALLTVALFFCSLLGHELAHAVMCKVRRIPVSGITLFLFGGATHAKIESRGPGDEFLITVVGPLTTAAFGGLFLLLFRAGEGFLTRPIRSVFGYLAVVNLSMAVLNVIPGFPLDGGRLLRSAIWKATGSLARATWVAARVGQGVGLLFIVIGVGVAARYQEGIGIWSALIGWFLFQAATATLAQGRRTNLLASVTAAQIMSPPPPTIDADTSVADAMDRHLMGHEGEAFPVIDDSGRVVGFVSFRTARGVPRDRRVRDAMIGTDGAVQAPPGERMDSVTERLGERMGRTVLVLDQGRLVGVIEPTDLNRFLRSGGGQPPHPPQGVPGGAEPPPRRPDLPAAP